MKKITTNKKWDFFAHIILIIFCIIILFPLFWVIRTSFANPLIAYQPKLLFRPTFQNYINLFTQNRFGLSIVNSIIVSVISTILTIIVTAPGAYAVVRCKPPGGGLTRFLILGTDLLPPIVIIIPLFAIFKSLNLVNTLYGLILSYFAFSIPFIFWMLISYFEGVPKEVEEAAFIDGANRFKTFTKIVLPLVSPGIMASAILAFVICWNEFIFALILTTGETSTIPVALAALQTSAGVKIGNVTAGTVIATFPILIFGFLIQKYLVKGLSFGAIK
jgi:multiple sugar transport system permease protein